MIRPPMELDIWEGDWGIPSVDLKCLEVMTYAKFSGVPLQTRATNNPYRTPLGSLPVLRTGQNTLSTFKDISEYLRQKNFCADFALNTKECAEVVAFTQLIKEQLLPGLQFMWWVDKKNYLEVSRPWYAKALPLPFNFYYPGKYERQAQSMMDALFNQNEDTEVVETGVYKEAQRCLTTLSTRLGESDFFFGAHPCSLDATVYAYLAPLLKAPLPSAALQNHLKACPNLVKFISRITQRYYPHVVQEFETKKATQQSEDLKDSEQDYPNKRRNQLLAGLFATLAMTGYAFATGLVEVTPKDFSDSAIDEYSKIFVDNEDEEND